MSRQRAIPVRVKACLGLLLLAVAGGTSACDEDGKTTPERCAALPLFDIQNAGAPADDNEHLPCTTQVGHAVNAGPSEPGTAGTTTAGTAGTTTGGTSASGGNGGGVNVGGGGSPDSAGAGGA